jgi:SAM-dependent methyltransferase
MAHLDFISGIHKATKRDYLQRVVEFDKAECAAVSKRFGQEYFDGDRRYGYGGFKYDGRWKTLAETLIRHYGLKPGMSVLDIGCAKDFLLHELKSLIPELEVAGIDISEYAIAHAMDSVKPFVRVGNATTLPFAGGSFDLVLAINTLHNLPVYDLDTALREIERVGRGGKFIVTDSYRDEREKVNLMYWQLTCECFFTPEEWKWLFARAGYSGDYDFVFFE